MTFYPKKQVSFDSMEHPETGVTAAEDPIEILRYIVDALNDEADIVVGEVFHTLPGSMTDRFIKSLGIKNSYTADLQQVMQELGVLRYRGRNTTTTWQVVDSRYFDQFVNDDWYDNAIKKALRHANITRELTAVRKALAGTEEETVTKEAVNEDHLAAMAEMVAEVERLRAELADAKKHAKQLQAKAKDDPNQVAAALIERFKAANKS